MPDAILLADLRAAYVEVPKVASSSIKLFLAELLGLSLEVVDGDPHRIAYPRTALAEVPPDYFVFAFVRNPWSRLVSCYRDKIGGEVSDFTHFDVRPGVANCLARFPEFIAGMSFEEFADAVASIPDEEADEHFRSQYTFLADWRHRTGGAFVGRYESLSRDFEVVRRTIGLPGRALPHAQAVGRRLDYRSRYTETTRRIVEGRYERDIAQFGYEF